MTHEEIVAQQAARWDKGLPHYRQPGQPFVGDPIEELIDELVDSLNYLGVARRQGLRRSSTLDVIERHLLDALWLL